MFFLLILFLFISTCCAQPFKYGFDTNVGLTQAQLVCLNNAGYLVKNYRLFTPNGVDCDAIKNFSLYCDGCTGSTGEWGGYIYPCTQWDKCDNATEQVRQTICGLEVCCDPTKPGYYWYLPHVWIDVEGKLWSKNKIENQDFIMEMIDAIMFNQYHPGIYTNSENWDDIVGADWSAPADMGVPLWWTKYNNVTDLTTNWTNFGGWISPYIHQYAGNEVVCGVNIDKSVMECRSDCDPVKKTQKKLFRNSEIVNACHGMPNPCYLYSSIA